LLKRLKDKKTSDKKSNLMVFSIMALVSVVVVVAILN